MRFFIVYSGVTWWIIQLLNRFSTASIAITGAYKLIYRLTLNIICFMTPFHNLPL